MLWRSSPDPPSTRLGDSSSQEVRRSLEAMSKVLHLQRAWCSASPRAAQQVTSCCSADQDGHGRDSARPCGVGVSRALLHRSVVSPDVELPLFVSPGPEHPRQCCHRSVQPSPSITGALIFYCTSCLSASPHHPKRFTSPKGSLMDLLDHSEHGPGEYTLPPALYLSCWMPVRSCSQEWRGR